MISTLCVLLLILWIGNYFIIHNDIIYMQYMYILYKNLTVNANIYMQVLICKNNIMRYSNSTFPYIKERKVYFKI